MQASVEVIGGDAFNSVDVKLLIANIDFEQFKSVSRHQYFLIKSGIFFQG
jgi:hypothetical protein